MHAFSSNEYIITCILDPMMSNDDNTKAATIVAIDDNSKGASCSKTTSAATDSKRSSSVVQRAVRFHDTVRGIEYEKSCPKDKDMIWYNSYELVGIKSKARLVAFSYEKNKKNNNSSRRRSWSGGSDRGGAAEMPSSSSQIIIPSSSQFRGFEMFSTKRRHQRYVLNQHTLQAHKICGMDGDELAELYRKNTECCCDVARMQAMRDYADVYPMPPPPSSSSLFNTKGVLLPFRPGSFSYSLTRRSSCLNSSVGSMRRVAPKNVFPFVATILSNKHFRHHRKRRSGLDNKIKYASTPIRLNMDNYVFEIPLKI